MCARIVVLLVLMSAGCVQSKVTLCNNGRTCPETALCDETHNLCIDPDQLGVCSDGETGACTVEGLAGTCADGVCVLDRCGDGVLATTEDCEPGVSFTATCSDLGFYDSNLPTCENCRFETGTCTGFCGDGIVSNGESCEAAPPGTCGIYGFDIGVVGCSAFCGPDTSNCRHEGLEPAISPSTEDFYGVYAIAADDVWAVGDDGAFHYDGLIWKRDDSVTAMGTLRAVTLVGSTLYVVGDFGEIWARAGGTWTETTLPTPYPLNAIWGASGTDIYAVGGDPDVNDATDVGVIVHFDGTSWSTMLTTTASFAGVELFGVWGSSASDVWVTGGQGTLLHRTTGSWSKITDATVAADAGNLRGVWGSGPQNIYVTSTAGTVLHYTGTWTSIALDFNQFILSVWGRSATDVYVGGQHSILFHYDGQTWTALGKYAHQIRAIHGVNDDDVWAVGNFGTLLHFRGRGRYVASTSGAEQINAIWGVSPQLLYAGGESGELRRRDGIDWTPIPNAVPAWSGRVTGLAGISVNDVYGTTGTGNILHAVNGTWSRAYDVGVPLYAVWQANTTNVFAVGRGRILTGSGTTWSMLNIVTSGPQLNATLLGVWGTSATNVYAVGVDFGGIDTGYILHYNGVSWTKAFQIDQRLTAILGRAANDIYVVGYHGTLLHFDGTTWTTVPTSTTESFDAITFQGDAVVVGGSNVLLKQTGNGWIPLNVAPHHIINAMWSDDHELVLGGDSDNTVTVVDTAVTATESDCEDYVDNDDDGKVDACDSDCAGHTFGEQCASDFDEDCDGLVDCDDPDCAMWPSCQAP